MSINIVQCLSVTFVSNFQNLFNIAREIRLTSKCLLLWDTGLMIELPEGYWQPPPKDSCNSRVSSALPPFEPSHKFKRVGIWAPVLYFHGVRPGQARPICLLVRLSLGNNNISSYFYSSGNYCSLIILNKVIESNLDDTADFEKNFHQYSSSDSRIGPFFKRPIRPYTVKKHTSLVWFPSNGS